MANLTAKELSALEDQLNCEQMLIKKFKAYAGSSLNFCSDSVGLALPFFFSCKFFSKSGLPESDMAHSADTVN